MSLKHLLSDSRREFLLARLNRFRPSMMDDQNPVFIANLDREYAFAVIGKTGNSSVKEVLAQSMNVKPRVSGYGYPWVPRAIANPSAKWVRRALGKTPPGFDPHARNYGWDLLNVPQVADSKFFRFGFVRNPWDRLVSTWSDKVKRLRNRPDLSIRFEEVSPDWSFDRFARWAVEQEDPEGHFRLQSRHVVHDGKLVLDFVGKFESLSDDWAHIATRLGLPALPRKNQSSHRPYRELYTGDLATRVGDYYREDIERFSYDF